MPDRPIGLVIFDCDGVLVDSEPLAMQVLLDAIAEQGIAIDPGAAYRDYLGRSLFSISESLNASHGVHLDSAALERMRGNLYAVYRQKLKASAWLSEALDALQLPFCVASSSSVERVRVSLEITGLLPRFEGAIFSASMVTRGKPAPDLFLHAAAAMGVAPEACLVIEDSPAGITAARAAGMRVFAYLGGGHVETAPLREEVAALSPDARFADMRMLPGLIDLHQARATGSRPRPRLVAAVDVGTASARSAIFDSAGIMLGRAERPIATRQRENLQAEHDSEQIWSAVTDAVRTAMAECGAQADEVVGLSFDATCSLVVRDVDGAPLGVAPDAAAQWDTIPWFDHRAIPDAAECTATGHRVLDHIGGVMSPEMEIPKLVWLKRHLPQTWQRVGYAFDLVDFLTWKASGSLARSHCTLTCKWTYLGHETPGWQRDFLAAVGVPDLLERCALPEVAAPIGSDLGPLTPEAAEAMGFTTTCRVAAGLVDAHAGALGAVGAVAGDPAALSDHLVLVAGTSSCIMALSPDPRAIAGVWGPFSDAVMPGAWLNEAGQSATGALLDHIIRWHRAGGEPTPQRHSAILTRIAELRARDGAGFAGRLHVLPDFHGNRSPEAQPAALGVISGLGLDSDFDSLCRLYWRTAVAIALQVRQLFEVLAANGYGTQRVHLAGGHSRNPALVELYAEIPGCILLLPNAVDATLLGVAMVAAAGCGLYTSLVAAAAGMDQGARERVPTGTKATYETDYRTFLKMIEQRQELEAMSR